MAEVKGKGKECLPLKTLQEVIYSLQGIWRHYQSRIYDNDVRLLRVLLPQGLCIIFNHDHRSWIGRHKDHLANLDNQPIQGFVGKDIPSESCT